MRLGSTTPPGRGRSLGVDRVVVPRGSRFISRKSSGIAMTTIQAPWVNLVTSTSDQHRRAVAAAPVTLIAWRAAHAPAARPVRAPARSSRLQCRTMPAWLRVKETKTPMM